ncbi:YhcG family protein [Halomicronema sp. CCY15110]|uniref:PDDEXK nuclease domain-containing protein n=1 Tax=Halomicronema sp. CCY15110 TaxID=2767773 RepID=UPI0035CD0FEF
MDVGDSDLERAQYRQILEDVVGLLESSRRAAARSVNSIMTVTYWKIGQRIFEHEQQGQERAGYGESLVRRLSEDLSRQMGRGFSFRNLAQMRRFYTLWPIVQTPSAQSELEFLSQQFPLPWSHYVKLMSVKSEAARSFYEAEALRNGWSLRQLSRQISTQFYERTLLSRNKAAMLDKGAQPQPGDAPRPEEEIKNPFVLEFLNLKDEYSESDLEEALIRHIENFLLELGNDFTFIGRQRRLRIGDQWFRLDLLFFHRRLRCLVIVDLKLGEFTHADAGQMHLYLNYAREHWTYPEENPPVGLILCNKKDEAVARYALEGLPNKVMAAEYQMTLPDEATLAAELEKTRKLLEGFQEGPPSG